MSTNISDTLVRAPKLNVPAMYDPGPAGFGDPTTWLAPAPCNPTACARCKDGPCEATMPKSWCEPIEPDDLPAVSWEVALDKKGQIVGLTWQGLASGDRGDWMQTSSGRAFYPMDPRPDEIHIEDIAAALSKLCRYGGHVHTFYSVAEHCVLMSRAASPSVAFEALMHDASEAYLSDVIRPIKPFLSNYGEIEQRLERTIAKRFDMIYPMPAEVKRLDNAILADERDQAMAKPPKDWRLPEPPLGVTLQFWSPEKAEYEFLAAFARLSG